MVNKDSCGHLIKQIHGALEKSANNALRSNDMTMAQVDALMLLNDSPEKQMSLKQMGSSCMWRSRPRPELL